MQRSLLLLLAASAAVQISPAFAQEEVIVLDEIVVDAADGVSADTTYEVPNSVTVITRDEIQKKGGETVSDILQTAPGVVAPSASDDPATSVNIRGLGDFDRVTVTIDGARQNFARSGHGTNGGFYVDRDMVKAVEIIRGPVAAVGGGGIGGAVALTTIDAGDVLRDDETLAGRIKTELETNMPAGLVHGEVATRIGEAFDIVAAGTARKADDYTDGAGNEINSADMLLSGLVKARIRPAEGHETTLSALRNHNDFDNGISTARRTEQTADTLSAQHRFQSIDTSLIDLNARAYYTSTRLDQKDLDGNNPGARRKFDTSTYGGELYNISTYSGYGFDFATTAGVDGFHDKVSTTDDLDLTTGSTPSGDRNVYGAYLQQSVERGWFEVIGAARYDGYTLDGTYVYGEGPPVDVDREGGRLSPKVTLAITPIEPVQLYATYAEGYRSPSVTETLVQGLHPPPVQFPFIPNPNLKPEVAHTVEGGVNLRFDNVFTGGDAFRAKAAVFQNTVDNFIDLECSSFPLPGGCEYLNIAEARLTGVELEATYDAGFAYGALTATLVEAENVDTSDDLQSVPPARLAGTIGARLFAGKLDLSTTLTLVDQKDDAEDFDLRGEGYGLIDVAASYALDEDTQATLTLKNLTDRRYVQYLNLEPSPGFSAVMTLSKRFGGSPQLF